MSIIHHANQLGIVIMEINPYIHNLLTYLLRCLLAYLWGHKIYLLAKLVEKDNTVLGNNWLQLKFD